VPSALRDQLKNQLFKVKVEAKAEDEDKEEEEVADERSRAATGHMKTVYVVTITNSWTVLTLIL
jgi:hypothetical protein